MIRNKEFIFQRDNEQIVAFIYWKVYHPELGVAVFTVRCPTEHWRYYLVLGVSLHLKLEIGSGMVCPACEHLGGETCFGILPTSQAGNESIWGSFTYGSMDDSIIFRSLESYLKEVEEQRQIPTYEI